LFKSCKDFKSIDEPLPINRKKAEEEKAQRLDYYFKETKKGVTEQSEVSIEQKAKLQEERQDRHEGVSLQVVQNLQDVAAAYLQLLVVFLLLRLKEVY